MKPEPHKAQNVLFRDRGGIEWAALVVDVHPEGCSLRVFHPTNPHLDFVAVSVRYVAHWETGARIKSGTSCYPPRGFEL